MRARLWPLLISGLVAFAPAAGAQATSGDPMADGLIAGDYLRVSGGLVSPINPQGSLRDWSRGSTINVMWENWQAGGAGVSSTGFGIAIGYTLLPLNEKQFVGDFVPSSGGQTQSATANKAGVLEVMTNLRIRIPSPFVMPSINLGFGFMDWRPGEIHYTATSGSGTAQQQHRSGLELAIGGGLDKTIVDRWAVFAEALYAYGFTSFGLGLATPGGTCASNGCDVLRNTSLGIVRGGLRVRMGR